MTFKDTDKGALRLRKISVEYRNTAQMMTPLEQMKAEALWKEAYSQETPGIDVRARAALAGSVKEMRNAEKALASERKKAAQRVSESPRLPNALALARVDFDAAQSPEELVRSIERVRASGDEVLQYAYGKTYQHAERKFTDPGKRFVANRVTSDAAKMVEEQERPLTVIDAEARLNASKEQVAKTREDVAAVANEFGLTSLNIWLEDAVSVSRNRDESGQWGYAVAVNKAMEAA